MLLRRLPLLLPRPPRMLQSLLPLVSILRAS
jgi:hypothetical protein